jgi:hypothetical protein
MDKKLAKLNQLRTRRNLILTRGKYLDAPGVLKKVTRQINKLEKELKINDAL